MNYALTILASLALAQISMASSFDQDQARPAASSEASHIEIGVDEESVSRASVDSDVNQEKPEQQTDAPKESGTGWRCSVQ